MAQFARPDNDDSIGSYVDDGGGTTNIYQAIDETTASDTDFIASDWDPLVSVYIAGLSSVTDPASSSGHILRFRYQKGESGGGQPATINLTVRLRQGTTTIVQQAFNDISTTWTDGSITLTTGQADSITDYSDLNFWVQSHKPSGARQSRGEISWVELEVPDVAGAAKRTFVIS